MCKYSDTKSNSQRYSMCLHYISSLFWFYTQANPISVSGILLFTNIRQMLSHYSQINDTNGQKDKLS